MDTKFEFASTTNVIFPKYSRLYTTVIVHDDGSGITIERNPARFNKEGYIDMSDIVSVDVTKKNVRQIGGGYKFSMVVFAILAIVSIFVYFPVAFAFILGAVIQGWLLKTEGYNVTILINKRNQKKPIEIMCHYDMETAEDLKAFLNSKLNKDEIHQITNSQNLQDSTAESMGWVCPNCGKQAAVGQKFCPECGTQQPDEASKSIASNTLFCKNCGASIDPDSKFCTKCGNQI